MISKIQICSVGLPGGPVFPRQFLRQAESLKNTT
jgi:hypothetical protein